MDVIVSVVFLIFRSSIGCYCTLSVTEALDSRIKLQLNTCPQTVFIKPVSEDEVEKVIKELRGKLPAGIDKVQGLIVEKCVQL